MSGTLIPILMPNLAPATLPLSTSDLLVISQGGIARKTTLLDIINAASTSPVFNSITGGADPFNISGKPGLSGGSVALFGADGAINGGALSLSSGSGTAGSAGPLNITAGNNVSGTLPGGAINIRTGSGAAGGALLMRTADGIGTNSGGAMTIRTGRSGIGGAFGTGGTMSFFTGDSQEINGSGGNFGFTGGVGTGSGSGGSFSVTPGVGGVSGSAGTINLQGATNVFQLAFNGPTLTSTGTLAASNAWLFLVNSLAGVNNATVYSPMNLSFTDTMNGRGNVYGLRVAIAHGVGSSGIRTAILGNIDRQVSANPGANLGTARFIAGLNGNVSNSAYQNGRLGQIVGNPNYGGAMDGMTSAVINRKGSFAFGSAFGAEINAFLQAGSSASTRVAIKASTGGINNYRADYVDAAFVIGEFDTTDRDDFGWRYGWLLGTPLGFFPLDSDSTVFAAIPKQYSFQEVPHATRGIDLQWIEWSAGGGSFLAKNFMVDEFASLYATQLWTTHTIQAATGTLTGIVINDAGEYPTGAFPTFTVQDPPNGGTTAAFTVATMVGSRPVAMSGTGRTYGGSTGITAIGGTGTSPVWVPNGSATGSIAGTVLTVTATLTGGIGSGQILSGAGVTGGTVVVEYLGINATSGLPTWTVNPSQTVSSTTITATGLGAGGSIIGLGLVSPGSWSIPPVNPVQLTDGSNTTGFINILKYNNDLPATNTFSPTSWESGATGHGYAVGDVEAIADDTGTPARIAVDTVTADGGITYTRTPVQFTATTVGGVSSQSITVSAVAFGKIVPNTLFNGTGFAANSVIKSQTSGTAGGAGEYLLFGVAQTVAAPAVCTGTGALAFGAHVTTPGSLTALSGAPSTLTNISGTGAGGLVKMVYGVETFTITQPGTEYPRRPFPKAYSSLTPFRIADLTPSTSPVGVALGLNGQLGGAVTAPNPTVTSPTTQVATANFVLNTGLPVLLGSAVVNLNTAGDQPITLDLRGFGHWRPVGGTTATGSTLLTGASSAATTAVGGIYTAAAKGGTALVPNTQAWAVPATTGIVLAVWQATPAATLQTATTLFFNLTTLEGTSRTATIYIYGILLP